MSISGHSVSEALWPSTDDVLPTSLLERIREGASRRDEVGAIDDETFDAVRQSGFLGAPIPRQSKGLGAGLRECCALQRALGAADPGLAIALNMHLFSVGIMEIQARYQRDYSWIMMEAIASQNRVVASAFGEPGLGGSIFRSFCRARRVEGGFEVTGRKLPCSLAQRCDLLCMQVETEPTDGEEPELLLLLVPRKVEGLDVQGSWRGFGMRASESDTVSMERCFVPERLVFYRGRPGHAEDRVLRAGITWFCLTTTASYLGAIRTVLEMAGNRLSESPLGYLDAHRGDLPTFQQAYGNAVGRVASLDCGCAGLASLIDGASLAAEDAFFAALSLKSEASAAVLDVASSVFDLLGAGSYARDDPLFRYWRDLQAIRFHPPTPASTGQILGREALGKPFTLEVREEPLR